MFVSIFNLGGSGLLISTLVVSFLVVFVEILPKSITQKYAEKFSMRTVNIVRFLIIVFYPITYLISILEKSKKEDVTATEEELIEIVQTIEHEGVIDQSGSELIQRAIYFDEIKVNEIMKKFDKVVHIEDNTTFEDSISLIRSHKYTRIPVINNITKMPVGIIYEHDVFNKLLDKKSDEVIEIKNLYRKYIKVFENQTLPTVLEKLQREKSHMAFVMDRTNKTVVGIITLEDLMEEIVGEIYDEFDVTGNIVGIGNHIYHIKSQATIYDLFTTYLENNTIFPTTKHKFVGDWIKDLCPTIEVNKVIFYDNLNIRILSIKDDKILEVEIYEKTKQDDLFYD